MSTHEATSILAGAIVTILLLIIAHIALWPYRDKMHRVHSYVVGVSCIGCGVLAAAALLDQWLVFVAFVGVTLPGGLTIMAAWWIRALSRQPADRITTRVEGNHAAVPGESRTRHN